MFCVECFNAVIKTCKHYRCAVVIFSLYKVVVQQHLCTWQQQLVFRLTFELKEYFIFNFAWYVIPYFVTKYSSREILNL